MSCRMMISSVVAQGFQAALVCECVREVSRGVITSSVGAQGFHAAPLQRESCPDVSFK